MSGDVDDVFETNGGCCSNSNQPLNDTNKPRNLRPRKLSDKLEFNELTKKVRLLARKAHRNVDDELFLDQHKDLLKIIESRRNAYHKGKERNKEVEDDKNILISKIDQLAKLLSSSKHVIVYTGAGISTSANIPDYRGLNGVWTMLNSGQSITMGSNPTSAIPTFTHMALNTLVTNNMIKYVVSQNCDGLHIRSGISTVSLAELHGNMFAEICSICLKSYYRLFDVTERTAVRRHSTKRHCQNCQGQLRDTIVHFGEISASRWPHNWTDAERNAEECDLILCLGSSLKVLRSYKKLWLTDRKKSLRPKLCIVNIQWTPKDSQADLKINGRTDLVMKLLTDRLSLDVPSYCSETDPLFALATPLMEKERCSFSTNCIKIPKKFKEKFAIEEEKYEKWRNNASKAFENVKPPLNAHGLPGPSKSFSETVSDIRKLSAEDCELTTVPELAEEEPVNINVPAWFGKGRKILKKKAKIKRRRKTN